MSLSLGNSTVIQYTVTNPLEDPSFVNDATVTVTIKDSKGVDLAGESWPVQLPYVVGSNGLYRLTFDPFVNLILGELYKVTINVLGIDGLKSECVTTEDTTTRKC